MIGAPISKAHLSKHQLLDRGWTHPLIKKLLGEPDKTVPNKRYWKPEIPVYAAERIREAEKSETFKTFLQRRLKERRIEGPVVVERITIEGPVERMNQYERKPK
jgi:hypothetical protein